MELGDKLRRLREAEGLRRGLWRALTQREMVRALRQELGVTLSQAYLSQLESGARIHLSHETREALARFYHVRPGDLVTDAIGQEMAPTGERDGETGTLARMARALEQASDPQRALGLIERVIALGPEELAAVEAALASLKAPPGSERDDLDDELDKSDPSATPTRSRS